MGQSTQRLKRERMTLAGRYAFVGPVNVTLLAAMLLSAEAYLRHAFPCALSSNSLHWIFAPGLGSVHKPDELVRDTNKFDYCVRS
jgi:hypothetical protein